MINIIEISISWGWKYLGKGGIHIMGKVTNEEKNEVMTEKKKANAIFTDAIEKVAQAGKRGAEVTATALAQTADKSKELANGIARGAKELSEKAKVDSYNRKIKKLNPLFAEEYSSAEFYVPNIICIVDDAVRRDVEECKGAIGWREKKRGTEVLYLYDEFVGRCGLKFIPAPICDEIYYVDAHDKKRFIKLDCVFQQAHEEKMAELEHIAYSLGAKYCSIEIDEKEVKYDKKKASIAVNEGLKLKGLKLGSAESANVETISDSNVKRSGKSETTFKGNDEVVEPKLKWFAYDSNVLNLIEYRCKGSNVVETKTLMLSGASSATMSKNAACSIDAAVADIGMKQSYSMESKSMKESSSTIIYRVEF